ncbi:MAG TPA: cyclic beta 1-2 glucan synthetase, partial [Albitalea sp.]|nr:cyclic beta 1-2 glucan synthetase [Albitalea sp.]
YLVDNGLVQLERATHVKLPLDQRVRRAASHRPLLLYAGSISLLTLLLFGGVTAWASQEFRVWPLAVRPGWWLMVAGAVLLLAASQLAVGLVNWAVGLVSTPKPLPRMDFAFGIPTTCRTLVVVPTMLGSEQGIDELVEALEVRFLANRDPQLHYGLLTDFHDAAQEHCPDDEALLRLARERIEALNRKYSTDDGNDVDRFFLFQRPRRWNEREKIWMGHERKRGKLADLNALLRGRAGAGPGERFSLVIGDTQQLEGVRYVITLDTDTQLPRDAAWQFVGTMAHPLNRPRYGGSPDAPIVVDGYAILQPRVGVSLPAANRSRYARLFGGEPGIDPYTRAVSDVYQDLFGEGSFIGKGIYDVDAFEHVLGDRLPENRILSHDLLEGCYARSGLVTDVLLFEESPSRYDADVSRRHRWIRGDWQIIAWLMPTVTIRKGDALVRIKNPLSALSRWKIFDNLRRSLVPAALVLLLVLGWTVLAPAWLWTLAGLAILFAPPLVGLGSNLLRKPDELRPVQHLTATAPSAVRQLGQSLLSLATLPYEAAFSLDALLRTVVRLWFTRRRLLEWQPSHEIARRVPANAATDLLQTAQRMAFAPGLALVGAGLLMFWRPAALLFAWPLLLLWFASPAVVWWFSRPLQRRSSVLGYDQITYLRSLARRTWAFFDIYVGPEDHYLPPDNMQEHPVARVAHRTSPTNIGLSLLANLTAYDMGYITLGQMIERTSAAFDTMDLLEKYETHWFNWYDTRSLQPLRPRYVSAVDSGNLAGHLLTLRAGLQALCGELPQPARLFIGMSDTLRLVQQCTDGKDMVGSPMLRFAALLANAIATPRDAPGALWPVFEMLAACSAEIVVADVPVELRSGADPLSLTELQRWVLALDAQCQAALTELRFLAPAALDPERRADTAFEVPSLLARNNALESLAQRAGAMAKMDYGFLYDPARKLMTIGYNVDERRRDSGYYDLLASEIRLASFIAIAQGQTPQESWFALGRLLTTAGGNPVLLSWSGSMFEYLMPMLVMPSYEGTLLDQTMRAAVERQIAYGRQRGVPWGISESGYNTTDAALNYQYRAFGV